MPATLAELAVRFGLELRGDPEARVAGVATLAEAGPEHLSFFANAKYRRELAATRAGAVVLDAASLSACKVAALVAANPYAAYARIAAYLHPVPAAPAGVDVSARVAAGAVLGTGVSVGALAYVGPAVRLAERVVVGPGCVLDGDIAVGEGTRLVARVTLVGRVRLGARCLLHPGAVLGADGFGQARERDGWVKVPQLGGVLVGNDVEIGANTTIDRGAIGDTVLEDGVKLDNQIQIGHNVHIGTLTAIAGCVGISGSTSIGARCLIGGAAGIAGHLSIADDVTVLGLTMVSRSLPKSGIYSSGIPASEAAAWRKSVARLRRLDSLYDRLRALEARLGLQGEAGPAEDETD
jgi:UDP-3-O-[3-hydroxymyristoyl] glucosamine N-acyltransferase